MSTYMSLHLAQFNGSIITMRTFVRFLKGVLVSDMSNELS